MTRRGLLLAAVAGGLATPAEAVTMTLKGRLYPQEQTAESGVFFTDPAEESESLTLTTIQGGWLHEYLKGSIGSDLTMTMTLTKHG